MFLPNTKPEHVFCPRELREIPITYCLACRFRNGIATNGIFCRYGEQKFHVFDFFGVEGCIKAYYRKKKVHSS